MSLSAAPAGKERLKRAKERNAALRGQLTASSVGRDSGLGRALEEKVKELKHTIAEKDKELKHAIAAMKEEIVRKDENLAGMVEELKRKETEIQELRRRLPRS